MWRLVGLVTRRSQVQILLPQPGGVRLCAIQAMFATECFDEFGRYVGAGPENPAKTVTPSNPRASGFFVFGASLRRPSPLPSGCSEFFLDFLVLLSRPLGNANFVVPGCFGCLPCRLGREHDIFSDVAFLVRYDHRRNMHAFQHVLEQFVSMSDRSQRPQSHRQALFTAANAAGAYVGKSLSAVVNLHTNECTAGMHISRRYFVRRGGCTTVVIRCSHGRVLALGSRRSYEKS